MKKTVIFLWLIFCFVWSFGQKDATSRQFKRPGLALLNIDVHSNDNYLMTPSPSESVIVPKKEKTLFIAAFSHLDSQWNWDYQETVGNYLPKTMDQNFGMMKKYPDFKFNFTGSIRYKMVKEYYPERYATLKDLIKSGQWQVSGSAVDEADMLIPSPESILRQILYGNRFFKEEYGIDSTDLMLPDCFGFPASLPTIINQAGLKGFSTQKLTWNSAVGIPFNLGQWIGVDDRAVVAALNPGKYNLKFSRLNIRSEEWQRRLDDNLNKYGVGKDLRYVGVGDRGGAPRERHIKKIIAAAKKEEKGITVIAGNSAEIFNSINPLQKKALPEFKGEMLLTEHSTGILTSMAHIKRLNRLNESTAYSAEAAASINFLLGNGHYPDKRIRDLWEKVLMNQMHDIITGTSIPKAYDNSFNDEYIALKGFRSVLSRSVLQLSRKLTFPEGDQHFIAFNPSSLDREEVFEYNIFELPQTTFKVIDAQGLEIEHQLLKHREKPVLLVKDKLPSFTIKGYTIVRTKDQPVNPGIPNPGNTLENEFLRVSVDEKGRVSSVFDKKESREILRSPVHLVTLKEKPSSFPAWNMDWKDRKNPAKEIEGKVTIIKGEKGSLRNTIQVSRDAGRSGYRQTYSLDKGSRKLVVKNHFLWHEKGKSLKQSFPLDLENNLADYHIGLGVLQRPGNHPKQYEVPSQYWFGLYDKEKNYSVSIIENGKYGSDKPARNELRLTMLYSPGVKLFSPFKHQAKQDWGWHNFEYAIYPHSGNWKQAKTQNEATFFNNPIQAFPFEKPGDHIGTFPYIQLLQQSGDCFLIRTIKKAETSDDLIIRIHETEGDNHEKLWLSFSAKVENAELVDGQERQIGHLPVRDNKVYFDLPHFSIVSIKVKLKKEIETETFQPVNISPFVNEKVTSVNGETFSPQADLKWRYPAEIFPEKFTYFGIPFQTEKGMAIKCIAQKIELPANTGSKKIYALAYAAKETTGDFIINGKETQSILIPKGDGLAGAIHPDQRTPGIVSDGEISWHSSHKHLPNGKDDIYAHCYLYLIEIKASEVINSVQLPGNEAIRIIAMTY